MNKVSLNEFLKILKQNGLNVENDEGVDYPPTIGVYHKHDWDCGYESGLGYNGTRRQFYADMNQSINFLFDYINHYNLTEGIISPCLKSIFVHNLDKGKEFNDIYAEIKELLKENKIDKRTHTGMQFTINQNEKIIEMIIEGAFRDISNFRLYFPQNNVLILPTHHFDLVFHTLNFYCEKEVILRLLKMYPDLKHFEYPPNE